MLEIGDGLLAIPKARAAEEQLIRLPRLGAALDVQVLKPKSSYEHQAYV